MLSRKLRIMGLSLVLLSIGLISNAHGGNSGVHRPFYLRALGGVSRPVLGEVDDYISSYNEALEPAGIYLNSETFGATPIVGVEMGRYIADKVQLGFVISYMSDKNSANWEDPDASVNYDYEYSLWDVSLIIKSVPAARRGIYLGVRGGIASGNFKETLALSSIADPSIDSYVTSDASGTNFVIGGLVGYELAMSANLSLSGQIGYCYRNLGSLEGLTKGVVAGEDLYVRGPVVDLNGKEIEFNFSGFQLDVGIIFYFGDYWKF